MSTWWRANMKAQKLTNEDSRRWKQVGKLAALGILLSYVEAFVPIPIPGVKLGLANIAVLLALAQHDTAGALCVAFIKVLASGLLFGSPLTIAYSACGTLLSLVGMAPLSRLRTMRLWMVSIVGALLHEAGQLMVASHLLGTSVVWYLAPVLAIAGCTCGLACGLLAQQFERAIQDTRDANSNENEPVSLVFDPDPPPTGIIVALVALLVYTVILLRISDVRIACGCVAFALVVCFVSPVTPHDLWRGIKPLTPLLVCTIVLQLALSPQTALHESALACTRLIGVSIAATAFMSIVPTDDLTCTVGWALSPLAHLGIDTRGFLVAFDVAVQTVPRLISNVEAHPHRLRDLPGVVIDSFARL